MVEKYVYKSQEMGAMKTLYKLKNSSEDFDKTVRAIPLKKGDRIIIQSEEKVAIGERYKDYPVRVIEIIYYPKKWWQFGKGKRQWGYKVMWE